jgi:hypothetical protein
MIMLNNSGLLAIIHWNHHHHHYRHHCLQGHGVYLSINHTKEVRVPGLKMAEKGDGKVMKM